MLEEEDGGVEEVAWEEGAAEVLLTPSRGKEQPATRSEVSVQASEGKHSRPPDGAPGSCATAVLQGDIYAIGGACPGLIHISAER
eukprot:g78403.t1